MSKTKPQKANLEDILDQPLAPELAPVAAELAQAATAQAEALAAAEAAEQAISAHAYSTLCQEIAAGKPPRPWSDYLDEVRAEFSRTTTTN